MKINQKKTSQLGMPIGTASGRLRKTIIFHLLKELKKNFCFQCGAKIESEKELSIEHKIPWLDSENPVDMFFNIENIAFSHFVCNSRAARPREIKHPSFHSYRNGCRCEGCKDENKKTVYKWRSKQNMVIVAELVKAPACGADD